MLVDWVKDVPQTVTATFSNTCECGAVEARNGFPLF